LAEYATLVLGLQHLVILAPLSDYGLSFKKTFVDVARVNGGEIVYEDWYVPYETKDFSFFFKEVRKIGFELMPPPPPVDTLAVEDSLLWEDGDSTLALSNTEPLDLLEEEEPPDSSEIFIDTIDAIAIVVETFEDAKTITPQRQFHRLKTQVLGNDLWYAPEEFGRLRRRDRSYFADTILAVETHDQVSSTREFVDAFRQRFRQDPLHAAHSYDAARLVIEGWQQGKQSHAELRQWLGAVQGFQGASGTISFAAGRQVNSEFNLLKIEAQRMRPLRSEDLPDLVEIAETEDDLDLPEMDLSNELFENEP
jgi:ABC-type branched-subunit amino acid transport system substrate-binding protein